MSPVRLLTSVLGAVVDVASAASVPAGVISTRLSLFSRDSRIFRRISRIIEKVSSFGSSS